YGAAFAVGERRRSRCAAMSGCAAAVARAKNAFYTISLVIRHRLVYNECVCRLSFRYTVMADFAQEDF
ncbi:MAG: hypothetical protein IJX54_04810, partial [Oscillospiraceae bacterium]|nr:hypothetical protein [Oscillospiraceae bacterium]